MTAHSPMAYADASLLALLRRRRLLLAPTLSLLVAVALAAVGAFGSYLSMAVPLRLLHFGSVGLAVGGLIAVSAACARRFWFDGELPLWAMLGIAVAMAIPGAIITYQALALWASWTLPYVTVWELLGQVLVLNIVIGTVGWALGQRRGQPADAPAVTQPPEPDLSLRAKLPVQLRHAAILALSAEDHYVRVRTDRGDALILMNLTAAMAAIGDGKGVRIHRSHWVSRSLAESATVQAKRQGIRIDDSTILPVSRAGRKSLQDFCGSTGRPV